MLFHILDFEWIDECGYLTMHLRRYFSIIFPCVRHHTFQIRKNNRKFKILRKKQKYLRHIHIVQYSYKLHGIIAHLLIHFVCSVYYRYVLLGKSRKSTLQACGVLSLLTYL